MKKYLVAIVFLLFAAKGWALPLAKVANEQVYKTQIGETSDDVIIGDEKSPSTFKPEITFTKWNKENSLRIKPSPTLASEFSSAITSQVDNKIEYKNSKIGWYANPDPDNADNFKFGIILNEKPATNVFQFQLEGWEEFDFFYQPPLANINPDGSTWEGRSTRPADVNGSYAVYHKTKVNHILGQTNYKTGKLCHIYRPKFIDANGNWVWGDLHIENGIYEITIPQTFLDSAVYPVKANDTFGVTTVGGSFGANYPPGGSWNSVYVAMATSPAGSNTLNSISWYLRSDATFSIKVALYDSSDKSRDAYTSTAFSNSATEGWKTSTGDLNVALTASLAYSSAYYHASGGTYSEYAYDDNAGYQGYRTSGDLPATWSDTADPITRKASTYATYTPAATDNIATIYGATLYGATIY